MPKKPVVCLHCGANKRAKTRSIPPLQATWDYFEKICGECGAWWCYGITWEDEFVIPVEDCKSPVILGSLEQMPEFFKEIGREAKAS